MGDRESTLELFDQALIGPENLHVVVRAQPTAISNPKPSSGSIWPNNRWAGIASAGAAKRGRAARKAVLEVRWADISICASEVRLKRHWPGLKLYAVWSKNRST